MMRFLFLRFGLDQTNTTWSQISWTEVLGGFDVDLTFNAEINTSTGVKEVQELGVKAGPKPLWYKAAYLEQLIMQQLE